MNISKIYIRSCTVTSVTMSLLFMLKVDSNLIFTCVVVVLQRMLLFIEICLCKNTKSKIKMQETSY